MFQVRVPRFSLAKTGCYPVGRAALLFALQALAAMPLLAQTTPNQPTHRRARPPLHAVAIWQRYLNAAEAAVQKDDQTAAKRYYLAALQQLEKDPAVTGGYARLERELLNMYPRDYSQSKLETAERLSLERENVEICQRLMRLNSKIAPTNALMNDVIQSQYRRTTELLKKEKETAAGEKKHSPPDTSP